MKNVTRLMQITLLFSLLLTACNLPSTATPEPDGDPMSVVNTAAAQTVIAMTTQLASGQTPAAPTIIVSGQATATQAVTPSATQAQAGGGIAITPQPIDNSPGQPTSVPCDRAQFVADVTVPDNANYAPGANFTKTWRLRNTGSCTWNTNYKLVFDTGDAMGGPASVNLPGSVAPGQEVDLSVSLKAPETAKSYQGYWKLMNANGQKFGLGAGDKAFWVKVVVGTTEAPFAVTAVKGKAEPSVYVGSCPTTIKFTYDITTSAGGEVTYYLTRSDGEKTSTKSVEFDKAGTKSVTYEWSNFDLAGDPYAGWVQLYNDKPNHQLFAKVHFTADCD